MRSLRRKDLLRCWSQDNFIVFSILVAINCANFRFFVSWQGHGDKNADDGHRFKNEFDWNHNEAKDKSETKTCPARLCNSFPWHIKFICWNCFVFRGGPWSTSLSRNKREPHQTSIFAKYTLHVVENIRGEFDVILHDLFVMQNASCKQEKPSTSKGNL